MKHIRTLNAPTPGLADYKDCEGEHAGWNGFRSHKKGAAYQELIETLCSIQHGLCGYCEIDITEYDRQVEHVIAQSYPLQGAAHTLDHHNMIACCKGGTIRNEDEKRRLDPVKHNRSCGQAKGNRMDKDFIDPRQLPALPSLIQVRYNGKITADQAACASAAIDAERVNKTISILGLNVKRLRRTREKRWRALSDSWQKYLDYHQIIREAARMELLPGEDNRLPRFFTTSRSYFNPVAEEILAEAPQAWI